MKKLTLLKAPKIFFDASIKDDKTIGVGIKELYSGRGVSIELSLDYKIESSQSAEELAMIEAINWSKDNFTHKEVHLFTDNMGVFQKYYESTSSILGSAKVFWLPRELNDSADSLSRSEPITTKHISKPKVIITNHKGNKLKDGNITDICKFLTAYPLNKKLKLLDKLAKRTDEKEIVLGIKLGWSFEKKKVNSKNTSFLTLVNSILTRDERTPQLREYLKRSNIQSSLSDTKIEKLLRSI